MEEENAREYLSRCRHLKECGKVVCSPWGFVSSAKSKVSNKRLLVVGLNAHDSGDPDEVWQNTTRESYSKGLKDLMRAEITAGKSRCLSSIMQPIARFLLKSGTPESQIQALNLIEWCNIVSCCPTPAPDAKTVDALRPSNMMRNNCVERLKNGEEHELLDRLRTYQPTHILVAGKDTKVLWERASTLGTALSMALNENPRPIVAFSWHPIQYRYARAVYWDHVYAQLSGASQTSITPRLNQKRTARQTKSLDAWEELSE